jgi:hypothetical protein
MAASFPYNFISEGVNMFNRKMGLTGAVLAAGLAGAGSIWAQAPGVHPRGVEGIGPMRGFERLHRELNLNRQQEALWDKAQTAQREAFRTMRAKAEEVRAKLRVEIDKPGEDLKRFAQLRDQLRTEMQAQMEGVRAQVRSAWFAVYDTLNPAQKEQVRVAIRDGMDRMGRGHRRGGYDGHRPGAAGDRPGIG